MKKKFDKIKKPTKSISDQVIETTGEQAELDVADLVKHGIKSSSIQWAMPIYEVLNHLKVHSKLKDHKGLYGFVNEAVKQQLLKKFPDECKLLWQK